MSGRALIRSALCRFVLSGPDHSALTLGNIRRIHYVQGQSPKPGVREYFYFINHEGQLFLDDARIKNFTSCFKEKKFLQFFMKHLKLNDLTPPRYPDFPYLSPCGRERNFIRCDDRPIVYTHLLESPEDSNYKLCYNNVGDVLSVIFNPELLSMDPESGRVYYPAYKPEFGLGLVKSALAIELSKGFEFHDGDETKPPKWFHWKEKRFILKGGATLSRILPYRKVTALVSIVLKVKCFWRTQIRWKPCEPLVSAALH